MLSKQPFMSMKSEETIKPKHQQRRICEQESKKGNKERREFQNIVALLLSPKQQ
jgi:hypothetical protein